VSSEQPTVRDLAFRTSWPFVGLRERREHRHERIISVIAFALASGLSFVGGLTFVGALFAAATGYAFNSWLKWIDIYGRPQ